MQVNQRLPRVCGLTGLIGAGLPIFTDITSWLLAENYSPIENSISNLAVGPSSWLMDFGLWCFVVSSMVVAIGLWSLRVRARYWTGALASLVLLAVCVGTIARMNDYAGTQNPGADIHQWATIGVAIFFALAALLATPGLMALSGNLAWFSLGLGIVWIPLAPIYYFVVPDVWSGALERLLALIMLAWLARIAQRLRRFRGSPPQDRCLCRD